MKLWHIGMAAPDLEAAQDEGERLFPPESPYFGAPVLPEGGGR